MNQYRVAVLCSAVILAAVAATIGIIASLAPEPSLPTAIPGAAISQLTDDASHDLRPAWSPDGKLIAFESNRGGNFHIYVMNADGSRLRALTQGETDNRRPVWTPDSQHILYDCFDGTRQDIWSVHVTSGTRRQLTRVDGLADFATLSPDGQQMVFYLYRDLTLNLWTARADGSDAKPMTADLADAMREEPTISWHEVAWSADSQWLAYTGGDGRSIWLMRRDGSDARCLVNDDETNHFPWFLPDGRLAFITEYVPPKYGAAWTNAWALDLRTNERLLLQEFMSMQGPVDWSADLSKILFHSPRDGDFDIYLIDLNAHGGLEVLQGKPLPEAMGQ